MAQIANSYNQTERKNASHYIYPGYVWGCSSQTRQHTNVNQRPLLKNIFNGHGNVKTGPCINEKYQKHIRKNLMKKFSIKPNPYRTCSIKRVNAQGGNIYCYAARYPERDYYHSDENAVDKKRLCHHLISVKSSDRKRV